MKVLFLDIDGVLNSHEYDPEVKCGQIHKDKVILLNAVLKATGAKIVMSSAWRYLVHRGEMNLVGLEWLLRSHGVLANRLVGITRPDTTHPGHYDGVPGNWPIANERGEQIADWIWNHMESGHTVRRHAVIDDLDLGISEFGHPLVLTQGDRGMTDSDARRLIEILGVDA